MPTGNSNSSSDAAIEAFFREFNSIEWKTYKTYSALSSFDSFWRETERLIAEAANAAEKAHGTKWKPESDAEIDEYLNERRVARTLHDEIMTPMFRYSAVVTLFSTLETELRRLGDNVVETKQTPIGYRDLKGPIIEQISRLLEAFCDIRVKQLPSYPQVLALQRVRDCIVHSNGEPSMSRDREFLVGLNGKNLGIEVDVRMPIEISARFIYLGVIAVRDLFGDMFTALGWTINDSWKCWAPSELAELLPGPGPLYPKAGS